MREALLCIKPPLSPERVRLEHANLELQIVALRAAQDALPRCEAEYGWIGKWRRCKLHAGHNGSMHADGAVEWPNS